jgi:hypothetical protein
MAKYKCNNCNKYFTRKHNYEYHINNIQIPCGSENSELEMTYNEIIPIHDDLFQTYAESVLNDSDNSHKNTYKENKNINDILLDGIDDLLSINPSITNNTNTCIYCDTIFVQRSSLNRHLKYRCKSKKNYDELEKLSEKLNSITNKYQHLEKECNYLKKENNNLKLTSTVTTINNSNNTNNTKNQINNGSINNGTINNNHNVTVQLVQFGCENIDDIDSNEALNVYSKSTGGNILSNVLKLVNLNENYPQNHNICITDLSREFVKVFNGKKFIVKKFKDIKGDIMFRIIRNTNLLVDKIENDDSIVLNEHTLSKMRINNVSIRLINGDLPEDIVRSEVREKDKLLKNKTSTNEDSENEVKSIDSKKEREFNLEERLRIKHLQAKQQGLIDISIERLKNELYNGKDLVEISEIIVKSNKKKKCIKIV